MLAILFYIHGIAGEDTDSEVEDAEDILDGSRFYDESGSLATAAEVGNGRIYSSLLAALPNRQVSTVRAKSSDPWSAGLDPWTRRITSGVADKYRHVESPETSTAEFADRHRQSPTVTSASATTRALFAPSEASDGSHGVEPPPIPAEVDMRRPTRSESTNISVVEARRQTIIDQFLESSCHRFDFCQHSDTLNIYNAI